MYSTAPADWAKKVFELRGTSQTYPVGWDCRIHRLLLCRGVRSSPRIECPGYDNKQLDNEVPVMLGHWGMRSTPSLPSLLGSLWLGVVAPDRVLSLGQIELNCVLMLNWITWNRNLFIFKLCSYAKLNCFKWNCFWMLNLIVWNRIVIEIETVLTLNWIVWNRTVLTFNWV